MADVFRNDPNTIDQLLNDLVTYGVPASHIAKLAHGMMGMSDPQRMGRIMGQSAANTINRSAPPDYYQPAQSMGQGAPLSFQDYDETPRNALMAARFR